MAKKKIKDLTIDDMRNICKYKDTHYCLEQCPLRKAVKSIYEHYYTCVATVPYFLDKDILEEEIEVEENGK